MLFSISKIAITLVNETQTKTKDTSETILNKSEALSFERPLELEGDWWIGLQDYKYLILMLGEQMKRKFFKRQQRQGRNNCFENKNKFR